MTFRLRYIHTFGVLRRADARRKIRGASPSHSPEYFCQENRAEA